MHARNIALHQIGDPYVYGAAGPNAFDCSGLVYFSYRTPALGAAYLDRPGGSRPPHPARAHLRRGDLMFFDDGGGVYHVGDLPALGPAVTTP